MKTLPLKSVLSAVLLVLSLAACASGSSASGVGAQPAHFNAEAIGGGR